MISIDDIRAAAERIEGVANRTPVLTSRTLDERAGVRAFVKAESFQRTGAFKFRGAYNRLSVLSDEERARGVCAYSSGNHAQAVALAARLVGAPAVIVMPEGSPAAKLEATRGYGAEVVTFADGVDRIELAGRLAEERGLVVVPPYEDPFVMAGQGTTALELLDQVEDLDALVVPIGGGGLISGCATAAKALRPAIRVVGVEPAAADDTRRSLEAGRRVRIPPPETIAEGLAVDEPGELTFEVVRRLVDEVVTVTEDELLEAMAFCFDRMKLVTEPSGVAAVAALLARRASLEGRVGVVLSGGNVGVERFADLMSRAGRAAT